MFWPFDSRKWPHRDLISCNVPATVNLSVNATCLVPLLVCWISLRRGVNATAYVAMVVGSP